MSKLSRRLLLPLEIETCFELMERNTRQALQTEFKIVDLNKPILKINSSR